MSEGIDLKKLLGKNMDDIKRKPRLPRGLWKFLITKQGFGKSAKKGTPSVDFTLRVLEAGPDVDTTDLGEYMKEMSDLSLNLQEEERIHNCWLSDNPNTHVMLKEFVTNSGVSTSGRTLEEVLPDTQGHMIMGTVLWEQIEGRPGEFREKFGQFFEVTD